MRPVSFHQHEVPLAAPAGAADIEPLPVLGAMWADERLVLISCWELAPEEWAAVAASGRIYLGVCGHVHPPVMVAAYLSDIVGEQSPLLAGVKDA